MKTQVNLKIDSDVKKEAQERAKEIGLSLSSVVNASLKQFAKTGELHLVTSHRMTPYLENLIKEARKEFNKDKKTKTFTNADEMIKSLED